LAGARTRVFILDFAVFDFPVLDFGVLSFGILAMLSVTPARAASSPDLASTARALA